MKNYLRYVTAIMGGVLYVVGLSGCLNLLNMPSTLLFALGLLGLFTLTVLFVLLYKFLFRRNIK